jgi:hypothetical protein
MVDAGRLPPLGPAAMFMVTLVHITARNITLGFLDRGTCVPHAILAIA